MVDIGQLQTMFGWHHVFFESYRHFNRIEHKSKKYTTYFYSPLKFPSVTSKFLCPIKLTSLCFNLKTRYRMKYMLLHVHAFFYDSKIYCDTTSLYDLMKNLNWTFAVHVFITLHVITSRCRLCNLTMEHLLKTMGLLPIKIMDI